LPDASTMVSGMAASCFERGLTRLSTQRNDCGRSLLDGTATDIDDRPAMAAADLARVCQFLCDHCSIDIGLGVVSDRAAEYPVLADVRNTLSCCDQSDDLRTFREDDGFRDRHAKDDRNVSRLYPAIGQINAGWRLRCAGYAHQD